MSGALALAASIAAMDRDELRALVASRRVPQTSTIADPLGLALELLRPDSMGRALQTLDRGAIATLERLDAGADTGTLDGSPGADAGSVSAPADTRTVTRLRAFGLVGIDGDGHAPVALPEVSDALRTALREARAEEGPEASPALPANGIGTADPAGTASWYAPALSSVRRAAALLDALAERPAPLGRRGRPTVVAAKELSVATRAEAEATGRLLAVVQDAGLALSATVPNRRGGEALLLVSSPRLPAAREWLALPLHARWARLAAAAIGAVDAPLRGAIALSGGDLSAAVRTVLPVEYPLLPQPALDAARELAATAEELGLTVAGRLSPPALALLAGDPAAARDASANGFPPLAEGVYLQPDLSLIVPGPLPPDDERSLAEISEAEQWGVAATLRLSPASLRRALRGGWSTRGIRELLARLSLTGIPQPLDYLLGDLERTLGAETIGGARSDAGLQAITAGRDASEEQAATAERDALTARDVLVERVYEAARSAPGSGELGRRLELAIRDRTAVRVTAAAAGQERSFTLLPVAITGGRLRATDEQAGVQRTLPLSAIVAVEAA